MTASIEFFPVGDGDMTLIRLATGRTILIDINIRNDADNDVLLHPDRKRRVCVKMACDSCKTSDLRPTACSPRGMTS